MALLAARYAVKGCAIILLPTILRAMASCTTKAAPGYTTAVLSSVVILIAFEVLCDIAAAVKQFIVIELTI
jgi:hypothetical protein